jgi:hypothetical protein
MEINELLHLSFRHCDLIYQGAAISINLDWQEWKEQGIIITAK